MPKIRKCATFFSVLLLVSCVSPDPPEPGRAPDDPPVEWNTYGPTLATLGRVATRTIPDLSSRIYALIQAALAAESASQSALAIEAIEWAIDLTQYIEVPVSRADLYSAIGRALQTLGRTESALSVLTTGVSLVLNAAQESGTLDARLLQTLEDLIYSLFTLGEDGYDQLRRAIQRVYIIPDFAQRVTLLTRIAGQYQTLEAGQRANLLLQQAIAALDAIDLNLVSGQASGSTGSNRFSPDRILAYTMVARRFWAQGDTQDALRYAETALARIGELDLAELEEAQETAVQESIQYLIEMDLTSDIPGFILQLPSAPVRQNLLISLARAYFENDQPFAAELIVQQIFQQLNANPTVTGYIYGYLRVVELYREAGDPWSAGYYLERLFDDLRTQNLTGGLDDFVLSEMLVQTVHIELREDIDWILGFIDDPYPALLALDRVSETIQPTAETAYVSWILTLERNLLARVTGQIDDGRSRLAIGYARSGFIEDALSMLASISDPYTVSLTASAMTYEISLDAQQLYGERLTEIIRLYDGIGTRRR